MNERKTFANAAEKSTLKGRDGDKAGTEMAKQVKATVGGAVEIRLNLEIQRRGNVTQASIVEAALDAYLPSFEFYKSEGLAAALAAQGVADTAPDADTES